MFKVALLLMAFSQSPVDTLTLKSPAEIIASAEELINSGEYDKAIDLYNSISENDTSYQFVQYKLLGAFYSNNDYNQAISIGEKIKTQLSEQRADIFITLGNAHLSNEDLESGQKTYKEGLELFPYNHILLYNLGITYYRNHQYEKAVDFFQKSAKINPFYNSNHLMLGYISLIEGHVTKSLLSYMTYMALNTSNNSALVFMNDIAQAGARKEGSITEFTTNTPYTYYDDLIKSKAALDSRFKSKVSLDAPIVKQAELLISKLKYDNTSSDFWMQYYVPFYQELYSEELTEVFLNYIIKSTKNETVLNWLEKNDKEVSALSDAFNSTFKNNRSINTTTILGKEDEYSFWYFNDNSLSAIGNEDGNEKRIGPWSFFSQNGQLNAQGSYNLNNEKIGEWKYFYDNGAISRVEIYNQEGVMTKPVEYFYKRGNKSIEAKYNSENEIEPTVNYYYECGELKESVPYHKGEKTGIGAVYFATGAKEIDYHLLNSEFDKSYTRYYQNEKVEYQAYYTNGELNGEYESYYIEGPKNEIGQYENGEEVGVWKGFHLNGQISYEGTFTDGKRSGLWVYYYDNGMTSDEISYDLEGKRNGISKYYNDQGLLSVEETHVSDLITGYKYFDSEGKILSEESDEKGNMEFQSYYPTGQIKAQGWLKNGKLNGSYISYFSNGNLFQEGEMIDDQFTGKYIEYYKSGELYVESYYTKGEVNGYYQVFYKNGQLSIEGNYVNDLPEGMWKLYNPLGGLNEKRYFINGKLHGKNPQYDSNEKVSHEYLYDADIMTGIVQYDTAGFEYHNLELAYGNGEKTLKTVSGNITYREECKCGESISTSRNYYADEKVQIEVPYKYSMQHGEYKYYYPNGEIATKGDFEYDKKEGQWLWYYDNGVMESDFHYENDKLNGKITNYYINGKVETESTYIKGELHGERKYFDHYGNLQLIKIYDRQEDFIAYINIKSGDTINFVNKGLFELKSYFKNGQLAAIQQFKDGYFDGTNTYYNIDGTKTETVELKQGDNHGNTITYYSNGKVHLSIPYKFDERFGVEKEYYENGVLKRETPYYNDKVEGMEIHYLPSGKVKSKIFNRNGYVY